MKILVINAGSSSLKYQLINMENEAVMCKGLCERIGIEGGTVIHKANGQAWELSVDMPTHAEAFSKMLELMSHGEGAVIADKAEIDAIGHRTVHGGEKFTASAVITDETDTTVFLSLPLVQILLRGKRSLFDDRTEPGRRCLVRVGKINPVNNDIQILETRCDEELE